MRHRRNQLKFAAFFLAVTACGQGDEKTDAQTKAEIDADRTGASALNDSYSVGAQELRKLTPEFERGLINVADNVHVAIGYGASVFTFIEGDEGIILIDAGQLPFASEAALKAYREFTDKPIAAIIFTHSHGDHINGAAAFLGEDVAQTKDFQIWGRDNFGGETASFRGAGIGINRLRALRQAGFKLPPEKRINNGIAPAVYPRGDSFNPANAVKLTHTFSGQRTIEISGVKLLLSENSGETADQIYIWYPDKKIAFAGDNFYKSWPNLYAIRGTPYRDIKAWISAIDRLRSLKADVLVGGHTRPIVGADNVRETLTTYFDGVSHVFNKTIEGINLGLGPDELVDFAKLPPHLANARVLRPYYGNPDWAVRSIFNGYLGWFDGNPTNLFPLPPKEQAQKMIDLAGGRDAMIAQMTAALDARDDQWVCELADYLLAIEPKNSDVMVTKAKALERLAEKNVTALARNYYFTSAQELMARAEKVQGSKQ